VIINVDSITTREESAVNNCEILYHHLPYRNDENHEMITLGFTVAFCGNMRLTPIICVCVCVGVCASARKHFLKI
jgi:hypothetical protein